MVCLSITGFALISAQIVDEYRSASKFIIEAIGLGSAKNQVVYPQIYQL